MSFFPQIFIFCLYLQNAKTIIPTARQQPKQDFAHMTTTLKIVVQLVGKPICKDTEEIFAFYMNENLIFIALKTKWTT